MHKNIIKIVLSFTILYGLMGCEEFLEIKSDLTLSTPESLDDIQALLDNPQMTLSTSFNHVSADEYFLYYGDWEVYDETTQEAYIWDPQLNNFSDWYEQYRAIFYANTALFNLDNYSIAGSEATKESLRGSAFFYRAFAFFQIAQLYASQYDVESSSSGLGIPLRLTANFNDPSTRPSLKQTYDQIVGDLQTAFTLLPSSSVSKSRPTSMACYALLARINLQIGDYQKAKENADVCLAFNNNLIDFNTLEPTDAYPLGDFKTNPEIVFYSKTDAPITANDSRAKVEAGLYSSFETNDLRKGIYFRDNGDGTYAFKGNYSGAYDLFTGVANDELYLIRAESQARLGNKDEAMADLNTLLAERYDASFVPLSAASADEALEIILTERKKELMYRGTRWSDLRRLNSDASFDIILERDFTSGNGQVYTLPPNDLRYTLLIPLEVMRQSSLSQNPR